MSNFKRFASSDNTNRYDNGYVGREGELTWDIDNGLRIHDGSTNGGNPIGTMNYYSLNNRPSGDTAINDLIGYGSSGNDGKFMKQVSTGLQTWSTLPTTYNAMSVTTLTSANVVGANVNVGGTTYTGLSADLGYGPAYRQVFLNANPAFMSFFNMGASIIGWKMYPTSNPEAYVTITEYLNNDLGGPSLGFDTNYLGAGPWTASSPGEFGPVNLTSNNKSWSFTTSGNITLPAGGDILDSNGVSVLGGTSNKIVNGDSNVEISTANGNITMTVAQVGDPAVTVMDAGANVININVRINALSGIDAGYVFSDSTVEANSNLIVGGWANVTGEFVAATVKTPATTVASLPSAVTVGAGARAFVTDGNSTSFYSIVGGSGSNSVPVFSDGTDWRVG